MLCCSSCTAVKLCLLSDKNATFFEGLEWNRGSGGHCWVSVHWTGLWVGTRAGVVVDGKNLVSVPGFEPT